MLRVVEASESYRYELRPVPGGESITAGNPSLAAQIDANPPPSELQMHRSLSNYFQLVFKTHQSEGMKRHISKHVLPH